MTARLVLVHGTRFSHTQWSPYADRLDGLEVVTPDLPGHGTRTAERFSTASAVNAIRDAVESGEPATPVVLAGHSLGGYMSMAYAAEHPDRLAGLVLIGSSALPRGLGAAAYRGFAILIARVGHDRAGRAANRVLSRMTDPATLEVLLSGGASYEATADAWAAVMRDCRPEMLREVTSPVLILNGRFDQLGVHARRFAEACQRGSVRVVPRATHLLPITHPDVVARELRAFVAEATRRDDWGAALQT
jgi:pimeloyl-ACP methyl ester carboxylesterase